jgi:hypothetical protein
VAFPTWGALPTLQRILEIARRGRKAGGPKQPHKVARRQATRPAHFVKKLLFIWICIEPVSLMHCLHQLAKERSSSGSQDRKFLKNALSVFKQISFASVSLRSDLE